MRELAKISDERNAHKFVAHLAVEAIHASVDHDEGAWVVWIHDDDDRDKAASLLEEFQQNPDHERYENSERKVRHVLKEAERLQKEQNKRQVNLKKRWAGSWWHCYPATYIIIGICVLVCLFCTDFRKGEKSTWGLPRTCNLEDSPLLNRLWILPPDASETYYDELNAEWGEWQQERLNDGTPVENLPRTPNFNEWRRLHVNAATTASISIMKSLELWRPFSPAFIHLDVVHLFFNMMWMNSLGTGIEYLRGTRRFLLLCLIVAITSSVAQLFWSGPAFGGMSGVVFGLIGYAWMKGKTQPWDGIALRQQTVVYCLLWMFLCMAGALGPIANTAHGVGLAVGMLIGARKAIWKKIPFVSGVFGKK